jgi:hypothetical protein
MTEKIYTPYACASVVNEWLKEDGVEKKLPPQMFYQYTSPKKNYIETVVSEDGKRLVTREALRTWYETKYMKKTVKTEEASEVDENQLELFEV